MPDFNSFSEFYPYYLSEHSNRICRRLHFIGSTAGLVCLLVFLIQGAGLWLLSALLIGYAFAWAGHFFFEQNRPATFRFPFYSFIADWIMYRDMLRGRISF